MHSSEPCASNSLLPLVDLLLTMSYCGMAFPSLAGGDQGWVSVSGQGGGRKGSRTSLTCIDDSLVPGGHKKPFCQHGDEGLAGNGMQ